MWTSLFQAIIALFRQQYKTGVVEDPRTEEAKQRDYLHEERAEGPVAVEDPFSNKRIDRSPYFEENQNQTSSCTPHGVTQALAIERVLDGGHYVRLSKMFPYRLRSNYPVEGSWPQEIALNLSKYGSPLYESLPTPNSEQAANAVVLTQQMYTEAEINRGKEFYTLEEPKDFEEIARIAQKGHGVAILIYARFNEWAVQTPFAGKPLNMANAEVRHCVCVLPKSGHWFGGERYVTIVDSAWFGGMRIRHLSESFIKERCYGALYWDTVKFLGAGERPMGYTFTKRLKFGDSSPEVKKVQELLIAEGLLPTDMASGYFGGRTIAGVRAFQNKYADDILKPLKLDAPTNTWGSMCIAKANALCHTTK